MTTIHARYVFPVLEYKWKRRARAAASRFHFESPGKRLRDPAARCYWATLRIIVQINLADNYWMEVRFGRVIRWKIFETLIEQSKRNNQAKYIFGRAAVVKRGEKPMRVPAPLMRPLAFRVSIQSHTGTGSRSSQQRW